MSQTLKVVAALAFVAVLGWVLLQPVLDAVDVDPGQGQETSAPPETPDPSPEARPSRGPTESDGELEPLPDEFRTESLSNRYPVSCFEVADPVADPLIATVDPRRRVGFGTPAGPTDPGPEGGSTLGRIEMVHGFNSSGDLYAAGSRTQALVASPQGSQGADGDSRLGSVRSVIWSPRGGCGVAIEREGSLLVIPTGRPLVRADIRDAAFSPDGRKLAIVVNGDRASTVWIATLSGNRLREVVREAPGTRIRLRGWSPDNKTLFYIGPSGALAFVTTSDPPLSGRVASDPVEQLEHCGDRLLGIHRGAIVALDTTGPDALTPEGDGYRYISCSPDASFIAAIGDEGLVLLDGNGNFLRDLTQDAGYTDVFVDWGGGGRGLIFGRVRSDASPVAAELWHIPEGGTPAPTGITYRGGPRVVDWAASPPTGLP